VSKDKEIVERIVEVLQLPGEEITDGEYNIPFPRA
jgi:hypothetical protein